MAPLSKERLDILEKISEKILKNLNKKHSLRVAIDGPGASGKSTLSNELSKHLKSKGIHIIQLSIDYFHNVPDVRLAKGEFSAQGYYQDSFNVTCIKEQVLIPLGPNGDQHYIDGVFNFREEKQLTPSKIQAPQNSILLFDGIFLCCESLKEHWDFKIFLDVTPEITLERALSRDLYHFKSTEKIQRKYRERYLPGYQLYLQSDKPQQQANLILKNDFPEKPTLKIVL